MAITFDNEAHSEIGSDSVLTFNLTVNTGSNIVVVVDTSCQAGTPGSVSTVTVGGVSAAFVVGDTHGAATDFRVEQWIAKLGSSSGVKSVVITWDGIKNGIHGMARSYFGVDQTTPNGTGASAEGDTTPATVNVTSAAGELVVDTCFENGSGATTITVGADQTQRYNWADGGSKPHGGSEEAGAGTVTMSWTLAVSDWWLISGLPLKPASEAPAATLMGAICM